MVKIFIFIFIFSTTNSFACKEPMIYKEANVKNFTFLESFLDESQEIFAGKIVNAGNERFRDQPIQIFMTKKIWLMGKKPHVYYVKDWYKNELHKENNLFGNYDFVSSSSGGFCPSFNMTRLQIPDKSYLYLGNSTVQYTIPLEMVVSLIKKLAERKSFWGNINPSWQFCEKNVECKVVKNKCGNELGINKKYEKKYLDFLESKESNRIDCSKEVANKNPTVKNKCVDYFCE